MASTPDITSVVGRRVAVCGQPLDDARATVQAMASWNGGRAVYEVPMPEGGSKLAFSSDQHAVFFDFQQTDCRSEIHIGSQLMFDGSATNPLMTVQPADSKILRSARAGRNGFECLAVLLDPAFVLRVAEAEHIADVTLTPSIGSGDELSWQLANAMRDECLAGTPHGALYIETAATLLSLHLLRHHGNINRLRPPPVRGGLSPAQLRLVSGYMLEQLVENVSLRELADIAGLSVSHFCRAFKASTGRTAHQWRTERRLERAVDMLADPRLSIVEIALASGYSSQSHFGHVFRAQHGRSPAAWRIEHSV